MTPANLETSATQHQPGARTQERIALLDIVRGVAVLGILLMNIRLFSEPSAAYFNPLVHGSYEGVDRIWWQFQYVFANQKFMAIFSMLFGASTAIIVDGLVRKGLPVNLTYARRIFGLLLIGLAHSYLLWSGDILVIYAMTSLLPFLFRNVRWSRTLLAGIGMLLFGTLLMAGGYYDISSAPKDIQAEIALDMWHPSAAAITAEITAHQGSWYEQFQYRLVNAFAFQTEIYLSWGVWRTGGMMLIGLSLYRIGFLQGQLAGRTYGIVTVLALPLGLALSAWGLATNHAVNWSFPFSFFLGDLWNYWGSAVMAIGYISLFGWLLKSTAIRFGFKAFTAVGKATLSNYLYQTLFCTTVFYGFGFGLFGTLARHETALVVVAVWATQILGSLWWFKHYSKGPVEAVWHRFTYAGTNSKLHKS